MDIRGGRRGGKGREKEEEEEKEREAEKRKEVVRKETQRKIRK